MRTRGRIAIADAVLSLLVVGAPIIFWRGILQSFDLVKATFIWLLGIPLLIWAVSTSDYRRNPALKAVSPFIIAVLISFLFSSNKAIAIFGEYARFNGALTLLACCGLLVITSSTRISKQTLISLPLVASFVLSFFTYLQAFGRDPFDWKSSSFGLEVFSLMGNPNTSAFFIAATLPLWSLKIVHSTFKVGTVSTFGYLVSLGSLSFLESFQAWIGILLSFLILLWSGINRKATVLDISLALGLLVSALLVVAQDSARASLLLSSCLSLVLAAGRMTGELQRLSAARVPRRIQLLSISSLSAFGLLAVVTARHQIHRGIESGFSERGDFFRAAWKMFLSRPITGRGLDSYELFFMQFRPKSYAIRYPTGFSSSAHNVLLGMLATGGIVLGLSFLWLLWKVLQALILGLRNETKPEVLAVGGSLVAVLLQSLVSVDHVAIYVLIFFIFGLVFRLTHQHVKRKPEKLRIRIGITAVLLSSLLILVLGVRPLLGDRAFFAAISEEDNRDSMTQLEDFVSATRYSPQYSEYWALRAQSESINGMFVQAGNSAFEAIKRANYQANLLDTMSRIMIEGGKFMEAREIWLVGTELDPHNAALRKQGITFATESRQALWEAGMLAEAEIFGDLVEILLKEVPA